MYYEKNYTKLEVFTKDSNIMCEFLKGLIKSTIDITTIFPIKEHYLISNDTTGALATSDDLARIMDEYEQSYADHKRTSLNGIIPINPTDLKNVIDSNSDVYGYLETLWGGTAEFSLEPYELIIRTIFKIINGNPITSIELFINNHRCYDLIGAVENLSKHAKDIQFVIKDIDKNKKSQYIHVFKNGKLERSENYNNLFIFMYKHDDLHYSEIFDIAQLYFIHPEYYGYDQETVLNWSIEFLNKIDRYPIDEAIKVANEELDTKYKGDVFKINRDNLEEV